MNGTEARDRVATEGVYPDGMPHPTAAERRSILLELAVLFLLTVLYLVAMPGRPLGVDVGLALVGMGLVGLLARATSERLWGPPTSPDFERTRRCTLAMLLITTPTVLSFLIYGVWAASSAAGEGGRWQAITDRLFPWQFFVTLILYVPWALVQQYLFQFYLLARWRALLPYASPLLLALLNGLLYGAVHLPEKWPSLVMALGGVAWSYSYHRDRYVLPLALSHAVVGATFYYWAYHQDLFTRMVSGFAR